jgi:hypothetical protein
MPSSTPREIARPKVVYHIPFLPSSLVLACAGSGCLLHPNMRAGISLCSPEPSQAFDLQCAFFTESCWNSTDRLCNVIMLVPLQHLPLKLIPSQFAPCPSPSTLPAMARHIFRRPLGVRP